MKALSFFSGAMGLDLGLESSGIETILACEIDKVCQATIRANRPKLPLIGDIWHHDASEIKALAGLKPEEEVDVMVGGPPCQAFSTAGARRGFEDDRGNALLRYVELILSIQPRYAVLENVRGLLSAPLAHVPHSERGEKWLPSSNELPGGALHHVLEWLRGAGYGVSFNLYNAANFGVPQSRERVIAICCRNGQKVPHLVPTHSQNGTYGLPHWRTLRDALAGMEDLPCEHAQFPEDRLRFYRILKAGDYWKNLPKELHREALGKSLDAGGGKTGFLRRLAWDKPSCTLVTSPTMPATDICHPDADRPLSIQEYKRVQQFPDDWEVVGTLAERYRQIGNAVPVGLGAAVGRAILSHSNDNASSPPQGFRFSRYRNTDEVTWEEKYLATLAKQSSPQACSVATSDKKVDVKQSMLFGDVA